MKRIWKKGLVLTLTLTLTAGGMTAAVYAAEGAENQAGNQVGNQKEEMVYVLAESDGSVKKIIVSDWLKNLSESASLYDRSALLKVENLKGNETSKVERDGTRIWNAQGKDIYYRGEIEKELPVTMRISYQLDGKKISAKELAGKSGKVTIRFDYENQLYQTVSVGGKAERLCVPFAMATGMVLDNAHFSNVEVSNGKLLNDGERTVVYGIAFPGLGENLRLSGDSVAVPDYVEVTADVTDFAMENTVTLVDNSIFADLDAGKMDSAEDLAAGLTQLDDAMEKLLSGASALGDGLQTLQSKSGQLALGVEKLAEGGTRLKSGGADLTGGVSELSGGITELSGGLAALDQNSAALCAGAQQVFSTMLKTADGQLAAAGLTLPALTPENYSSVLEAAAAAAGEANGAPILTLKAQLDSYNQFYMGLQAYTEGVGSAKTGAEQLHAGAQSLDAGAKTLYEGIAELQQGIGSLQQSMPVLVEGVSALADGAQKLNSGLVKFDEEGISKLTGAAGGDLGGLLDRMKATIDLSRSYQSFSGISEDMSGRVKFVYRTEAIEKK